MQKACWDCSRIFDGFDKLSHRIGSGTGEARQENLLVKIKNGDERRDLVMPKLF